LFSEDQALRLKRELNFLLWTDDVPEIPASALGGLGRDARGGREGTPAAGGRETGQPPGESPGKASSLLAGVQGAGSHVIEAQIASTRSSKTRWAWRRRSSSPACAAFSSIVPRS